MVRCDQEYDMLGYDVDIIITVTIATTINIFEITIAVAITMPIGKIVLLNLLLVAFSFLLAKPLFFLMVCFLIGWSTIYAETIYFV